MKMNEERMLPVSQEIAWQALNDIALLKACIPGCESILLKEDGSYELLITASIGPVKAKFKGGMSMKDVVAPTSYTLEFTCHGGAVGFGKGEARVALSATSPDQTQLAYSVTASVGGRLAQIGARLIDIAAKKMATDFFGAFIKELELRHVSAGDAQPAVADAPGAAARSWLDRLTNRKSTPSVA